MPQLNEGESLLKRRLKIAYEIILVLLALISIVTLYKTTRWSIMLDRIIWLIFLIDLLFGVFKSKHKFRYLLKHPIEVIAALPLDSIFQSARVIRIFRILRFFSIGKKYFKPIRDILKTNGLNKILATSGFTLIGASILVNHFEPGIKSYADGLWWSIVTTTTVGYGDLSPKTPTGRLIAVVLMLIGIGIIGTLTSSITTYFIHDRKRKIPAIQFIQNELDRYEELTPDEKNRVELLLHDLNENYKKNTSTSDPPA